MKKIWRTQNEEVNPHANIGKPLLVIIFVFLIYSYFYISTGVPSYLDFPPLVNKILVQTGYLEEEAIESSLPSTQKF